MRFKKYLPLFFLLLIFFLVFRNWFSLDLIAAGDFPTYTKNSYQGINVVPYSWGIGVSSLGGFLSPISWSHFISSLPLIFGKIVSLEWIYLQRIFYLFPLLAALFFIPMLIFKKLLPDSKFLILSSIIFSLNTYILMLIGGGQIFLAIAYALIPMVFYSFIQAFNKKSLFYSFLCALIFSFQIMLDLRVAYISIFSFVIYLLFNISISREYFRGVIFSVFIPAVCSLLAHSYWLIPTFLTGPGSLDSFGEEYTTSGIIEFLSFARLENSISLLHPNWPENIFGKIYFMRAEFLLLPILAFSSLLFIEKVNNLAEKRIILFFAGLALIGAFLAKGANEPFGQIYIWMFENIPGFIMFRDSTKWYALIAFSYSILIPYCVEKIFFYLRKGFK